MVITDLRGGLGNQVFQYAAGRALAIRRRVPLLLNLSWFSEYGDRRYRLDHYHIAAQVATAADVARIHRPYRGWLGAAWSRWQWLLPYYRRYFVEQGSANFDPNILRASGHVHLSGYWQSERYFAAYRDILLDELTVVHKPDAVNREMADRAAACESVGVHVRRGDYISNPRYSGHYAICGLDYYAAAVAVIRQRVRAPRFFLFSDDLEWAMANLDLGSDVTPVVQNGEERDYEDLRLMSSCRHFIIANSSFSWWGAWLSRNPGKIVIAPNRWFRDPHHCTRELIPPSWIRV